MYLRYDAGGEPPVWPRGLSALHRLGTGGHDHREHGRRRSSLSGGPRPEPGLYQGGGGLRPGAGGLRGQYHAPGGRGVLLEPAFTAAVRRL